MIKLLLLLLTLAGLYIVVKGIARLPAPQRKQMLRKLLFWLLIGVLVGLALTGRLHWLVAAIAALFPLIKRLAWRFLRASMKQSPPRPPQNMSEAEACAILELPAQPSAEEIKAAHRRLMQVHHPDRGGSLEQSQRINLAKDFLLKKAQTKQ